jgi:hypothetical protein
MWCLYEQLLVLEFYGDTLPLTAVPESYLGAMPLVIQAVEIDRKLMSRSHNS